MNDKLVEELGMVFGESDVRRIIKILSRYTASVPCESEGLRECKYWDGIANKRSCENPTPDKTEPLAMDSIGCCPKCGVLIKDITHESLAVLADRNFLGVRLCKSNRNIWTISLRGPRLYFGKAVVFYGDTYQEAESKCRQYLEGLEDVK